MAQFGALWVGRPLTKIQIIGLSSFAHYGHDVYLYVYDDTLEVPVGITKRDAREIMPEESLFTVRDSYAAFSDIFRYHMIKKTGLAWVDADVICTTSDWEFKDNIYCSKELETNIATGSVLSMPADSEAIEFLIKESEAFDKKRITWVEIGPALVDKAFKKYGLSEYIYDYHVFCGIGYSQWYWFWRPEHLENMLKIEKISKAISICNFMCTVNSINKNELPEGTAIKYFYDKFYKGMTV